MEATEVMRMGLVCVVLLVMLMGVGAAEARQGAGAASGAWVRYELLSAVERKAPPVSEITLLLGPKQAVGQTQFQWWEIEVKKASGERFAVRLLSESVPMAGAAGLPGKVKRYMLREGESRPVEYIDSRTGDALLPKFEFATGLLPQPVPRVSREGPFPVTGTCLGHVLSLAETGTGRQWAQWPEPAVVELRLDELHYMYGLARDTEGRYISEGDYTYVPLTREELDEMIDLGMNSFSVDDKYEEWVCRRPVFYYKQFGPETKVNYPEILFRSNFRGAVPFIDEPAIHLLGDPADLARIRRPEDGAWLISKRVEDTWGRPGPGLWRRGLLREQLAARGANLGTLALDDDDHPIWETITETAFYQLQGGASGILHEGRYQLEDFIKDCERFTGPGFEISVKEMLLLDFAWMRGAARAWGKSWGVSIYGQCDPRIAPQAITLAYDMGARYIWFWTYDHQHHLPHYIKLDLLKHLKRHKAAHPRKDTDKLLRAASVAIVLPYGYGWTTSFYQMWESPHLNVSSANSAGVPHAKVVEAALRAALACARVGEGFDFTMDAGQGFDGYKKVIRIGLDGKSR